MCTKNIGLTGAGFARRVSVALINKIGEWMSRVPPVEIRILSCGESWVRHRAMKSGEWKTYRTRFLVKAKQLNSSLSFVDQLGRQHVGRKGDYLVESSEGVISIAPRRIFEDIYVMMGLELENEITVSRDPGDGARKLPQPCRERRGTRPNLGVM